MIPPPVAQAVRHSPPRHVQRLVHHRRLQAQECRKLPHPSLEPGLRVWRYGAEQVKGGQSSGHMTESGCSIWASSG